MEFDYALAHTVLRLRFQKIRTRDALAHTTSTSFEGTAEVVTEADGGARRRISVPDRSAAATTTSRLVLTADRRLSAVEATSTGNGPAWVKAGVGLATTLVGAVVSFVNPVIGLGMAAAGLATTKAPVRRVTEGEDTPPAAPEEDYRLTAYGTEHGQDKELLVRFRQARAQLLATLADCAASSDAAAVRDLSRRLVVVSEQLVPLEAAFAVWLAAQKQRELLDLVVIDIGIGQLPTDKAFASFFRRLQDGGPHAGPLANDPEWATWAFRSGLGVSAEFPDPRPPASAAEESRPITLNYREGTTVVLTTWSVTRRLLSDGRDGGGNEVPDSQVFDLVRSEVRRLRVVRSDAPVRSLHLDVDAWHSGTMKVGLNELGEPSEVGGTGEGLAAATAADLPGTVKDALATGSAIAGSLVPGSALESALTREVAIAKARADLLPAKPSAPTPAEQAVANLKAEVELAELQARLRLAQGVQGTAGTVILRQL
ncbi:MAG TPA: hypothetical protein PLE12_07510 [Propionicimonas sp.]|nr:hypothetical protein [Propionicimonas sp.]